jgi:hypothetical protein
MKTLRWTIMILLPLVLISCLYSVQFRNKTVVVDSEWKDLLLKVDSLQGITLTRERLLEYPEPRWFECIIKATNERVIIEFDSLEAFSGNDRITLSFPGSRYYTYTPVPTEYDISQTPNVERFLINQARRQGLNYTESLGITFHPEKPTWEDGLFDNKIRTIQDVIDNFPTIRAKLDEWRVAALAERTQKGIGRTPILPTLPWYE